MVGIHAATSHILMARARHSMFLFTYSIRYLNRCLRAGVRNFEYGHKKKLNSNGESGFRIFLIAATAAAFYGIIG